MNCKTLLCRLYYIPLFSVSEPLWLNFPFFPGIDLENIVYYKDDTHYFVMTAKKKSLLEKGVIKEVRTKRLIY